MKRNKEEVKNKANKRITISITALIVLIISVIIFLVMQNDKNYEIEVVTEFSYFKLYENEKYGVIDTKRECINRAKI